MWRVAFSMLLIGEILWALQPTPRLTKWLSSGDDRTLRAKIVFLPMRPSDIAMNRHIQRDEAVSLLREFADKKQSDALPILDSLVDKGSLRWYRRLWIVNAILIDGDRSAMTRLLALKMDGFLDTDPKSYALLSDSIAYGVERVGATEVWDRFGLTGKGVVISLLDTGIRPTTPDLADHLWHNSGEIPHNGIDDDDNGYIDDYIGYNFVADDGTPYDDRGHGTHTAGTAAGDGTMGVKTGVAPDASIMELKVLDADGNGIVGDSWNAMQYAVDNGANVASLSLGWIYHSGLDRAGWRAVMDNCIAAGLVVAVAAGNEGDSDPPNNLRCPGDVPSVITVGAVEQHDSIADFSSAGPVSWADVDPYHDYPYPPGLIKPDVVAPGGRIVSTVIGGTYGTSSGTSMACPHIAGAAALLLQANPDLDNLAVKAVLESTAIDLGDSGKDNYYGSGRIRIVPAIETVIGELAYIAGNTLPGATIDISPGERTMQADTITGHFAVAIPADSIFTVQASLFGYYTDSVEVSSSVGDTAYISLPLTPMPTAFISIELRRFDTGEFVNGWLLVLGDSIGCDGVVSVSMPEGAMVSISGTAEGFSMESCTLSVEAEQIVRLFLHHAENFEDSSGGFTGTMDWEYGVSGYGPSSARSGAKLWGTKLDTVYSNSSNSWLITPVVYLSGEAPRLSFWQWFSFEATVRGYWDGGNVSLSTDGGTSFTIIYPSEGYPCHLDDYNLVMPWEPAFSDTVSGRYWHQEVFDLSAFEGETVMVAFHFGSDDNTPSAGWYIDDVVLAPATHRCPFAEYIPSLQWEHDTATTFLWAMPVNSAIDTERSFLHYFVSVWDSVPLANFAGDTFIARFPVSEFNWVEFYFTVCDTQGLCARVPELGNYTEFVGVDTLPPRVTSLLPTRKTIARDSLLVAVYVEDETGVQSTSVMLLWEMGSTTGELIPDSVAGDTFTFSIPDSFAVGDRVLWRVFARDESPAHNNGFSPYDSIFVVNEFTLTFDSDSALSHIDSLWQWGDYAGETLWGTRLGDMVSPGAFGELMFHFVSLRGLTCAYLQFEHYFKGGYGDGGQVIALTDSDTLLLMPSDGYDGTVPSDNPYIHGEPAFIGTDTLWRTVSISLDEFVDGNITLAFKYAASAGGETGWLIDNLTLVAEELAVAAPAVRVHQITINVSPNPFNSSCVISVAPEGAWGERAQVEILDVRGNVVYAHNIGANGVRPTEYAPTNHTFIWTPDKSIASGIYLVRVKTPAGHIISKRIVYIK